MQQVLIEAMKSDIEEGNFSDVLLKKIKTNDDDNVIRKNSSGDLVDRTINTQCTTGTSECMNDYIDMFNKLGT
jgi:hypothetical protein